MTPDRSITGMPRAALPHDVGRAKAVVWGMAVALGALFAIGQIVTVLAVAPAAIAYHAENGGAPAFVMFAASVGPFALAALLVVADALLLGLFLWLARRYWLGFAYVPPMLYLGLGSILIWLLVSGVVANFGSA